MVVEYLTEFVKILRKTIKKKDLRRVGDLAEIRIQYMCEKSPMPECLSVR
jgi:hypothetical protein